MPSKPSALILDGDGPRQLSLVETARGLGLPKNWNLPDSALSAKLISNSASLYHWEYVSQCFLKMIHSLKAGPTVAKSKDPDVPTTPNETTLEEDWPEWKPPDMTPGGVWHQARVDRLKWACSFYDKSDLLFEDGLAKLAIHRQNYDDTGPAPKRLQLLWWEFPQSQWEDIRLGGSMNFLKEPIHQIAPNSPMTAEELKVAEEFVDELIALGVLREPANDNEVPIDVLTNAPLFTVPKPGQPGQYRCIADMLCLPEDKTRLLGTTPSFCLEHPTSLTRCIMGGSRPSLTFPNTSTTSPLGLKIAHILGYFTLRLRFSLFTLDYLWEVVTPPL